ncbi:MAG: nucleotide exchange factor GrpE [Bacteroidota bacterium]|nr:nucleotide exchange factor GrpE [Bacteroidota bacterium]
MDIAENQSEIKKENTEVKGKEKHEPEKEDENKSPDNGEEPKEDSSQDENNQVKAEDPENDNKEESDVKEEQEDKPAREDELARLLSELAESKDKYLRLSAEFDNYRRRTLKEKMDLTKTAGKDIMVKVLPVLDDFERAMGSMKDAKDCNSILNGVSLIYNKFKEFISQQGVSEIDAIHKEFDTDLHEALTKIPAPKKKLKGKVVDVVEKGYTLHDKVIRFSKVVIGE